MDSLSRRAIRTEILDEATDAEAAVNLRDLRRINRWFGGHGVLRRALRRWYAREGAFRMLDIGAASGDMGAVVQRAFPQAEVVSLDRVRRNLRRAAHPKLVADAFQLPFASGTFDVAACSLFLHHFREAEAVRLLKEMRRVSRAHVLVIDLERSALARGFLPATRWLFGWHAITLHDGPVSVEAGFRKDELRRLGEAAGLREVQVRVHRPWFRLSMTGCV